MPSMHKGQQECGTFSYFPAATNEWVDELVAPFLNLKFSLFCELHAAHVLIKALFDPQQFLVCT